jgi:hypothetical protein
MAGYTVGARLVMSIEKQLLRSNSVLNGQKLYHRMLWLNHDATDARRDADSLGIFEIQGIFSFSLAIGSGYQGIWRSRYKVEGNLIVQEKEVSKSCTGPSSSSPSPTQLQPNNLSQIF